MTRLFSAANKLHPNGIQREPLSVKFITDQ
jgi:hypothetical protein